MESSRTHVYAHNSFDSSNAAHAAVVTHVLGRPEVMASLMHCRTYKSIIPRASSPRRQRAAGEVAPAAQLVLTASWLTMNQRPVITFGSSLVPRCKSDMQAQAASRGGGAGGAAGAHGQLADDEGGRASHRHPGALAANSQLVTRPRSVPVHPNLKISSCIS